MNMHASTIIESPLYVMAVQRQGEAAPLRWYFDLPHERDRAAALAADADAAVSHSTLSLEFLSSEDFITDAWEFKRWLQGED